MDGRHASQTREAHVQRRSGAIGQHGNFDVVDVRYRAQPGFAIKLTRLSRNITRREMQAQIRRHIVRFFFSQHGAVPIGIELIDDHAVATRQRARFVDGDGEKFLQVCRLLQPSDRSRQ